jgi:hypothetical protein
MTTALMVFLAKLVSGANARWAGCGPDTRQRIYFANHTSNLDALVLWAVLPSEVRALTRPVAARDYWTAGKIRRHIAQKVFNAILIERKKPTAHDNPIAQILSAALMLRHSFGLNDAAQAIERAVVLGSSIEILPEDLPEMVVDSGAGAISLGDDGYHSAVVELKKRLIVEALDRSKGSVTEAAKLLKLHPNYLHRLMNNLNLRAE